jgi:hypothetical protein
MGGIWQRSQATISRGVDSTCGICSILLSSRQNYIIVEHRRQKKRRRSFSIYEFVSVDLDRRTRHQTRWIWSEVGAGRQRKFVPVDRLVPGGGRSVECRFWYKKQLDCLFFASKFDSFYIFATIIPIQCSKKKNLQKYGRLQPPSRQALTARSKVRTSAFVPLLFSLLQSHVVADHDGASSGPSTA